MRAYRLRAELIACGERSKNLAEELRAVRAAVSQSELTPRERHQSDRTESVVRSSASAVPAFTPSIAASSNSTREDLQVHMRDWRAAQATREIGESIALDPAQYSKLQAALVEAQELGVNIFDISNSAPIVEEVLGATLAKEYREKATAELHKEFEERIDNRAILLSRKLGLTGEQEQKLRVALMNAEQLLSPERNAFRTKMQEAMANHLGGDEAKATLTAQYDSLRQLSQTLEKKRDAMVFDQIQSELTDAQKNALLEAQAEKNQ